MVSNLDRIFRSSKYLRSITDTKVIISILASVGLLYSASWLLSNKFQGGERDNWFENRKKSVNVYRSIRRATRLFVRPRDPVSILRIESSLLFGACLNVHAQFLRINRPRAVRRLYNNNYTIEQQKAFRDKLFGCLENVIRRFHVAPSPVQNYLKKQVQNPYEYNRSVNPRKNCRNKEIEVLFTVPSAPEFFRRRQFVRSDNRMEYVENPQNKAVLIFFLGRPADDPDGVIQARIDDEIEKYGDIVQTDFEDVYRNVRLKAMSMLKWAGEECGHAEMVIRTDDDVSVNVTRVIAVMRKMNKNGENFVLGRRIVRDIPSTFMRWYLGKQEYPFVEFPPYVRGGLIGYPMSTVKLLFQAALRHPPIWLDDVFITGLCAGVLGFPVYSHPRFDYVHKENLL